MKISTKAALLSGLIFPGIGHLILKYYVRASILIILSLIAVSAIVNDAFQQAQTIVDRINSGEIPLDSSAITEAVSASSSASDSFAANAYLVVFIACWLIGIIDSYRVGAMLEKMNPDVK